MKHSREVDLLNQEPPAESSLYVQPAQDLEAQMARYRPIRLQEISEVELLNRVDTKYVLSLDQLLTALSNLSSSYRILEIDQRRIHSYRTMYYDTSGFDLYHNHVTQRKEIHKVRIREYSDSGLRYLEIKLKNQKRRTLKSRLPVGSSTWNLDTGMRTYLSCSLPYSGWALSAVLLNSFRRVTLVNLSDQERLTIDIDLRFDGNRHALDLCGICIAEIKQVRYNHASPFVLQMRRQGVRETGFSKYCFGVSQLYPGVKKNTQKIKLLLVNKLLMGDLHHACFA